MTNRLQQQQQLMLTLYAALGLVVAVYAGHSDPCHHVDTTNPGDDIMHIC